MDISSLVGPPRLHAEDIPEEGVTRTIRSVSLQRGRNPIVVHFRGEKRGLALSPSGVDRVAHEYGVETDEWVGRRLHLFPAVVSDPERGSVAWIRVETETVALAESA